MSSRQLTQALDADAPRRLETPFIYPDDRVTVALSANARFVLAVNRLQGCCQVRLHDTHTDKMFTATLDMSRCFRISVCDNGLVCLGGAQHYVRLELPRSGEERTLVAHSERCDGYADSLYRPARQGDVIIKEVQERQGDRRLLKLMVEGLDGTTISLEHPQGPSASLPRGVTVSPLRELVAATC